LDFNLTLENSQIGLIPDFIGYIVMINGIAEMAGESPLFLKVKPFAAGMELYRILFSWICLESHVVGALSLILAVASLIITLYISYHIVMGVKEMEEKFNVFLIGTL
jgi:hypothetical protein